MSETTDQRPTQATLGGWLVVSGSVFLVASLFSTVSSLRSLETRTSIEEFLSTPPGSDLGIGVQETVTILHALAMVTGGCAAAMAVLGVFALRREKSARLALSVLAVPLLLAGVGTGGLLAVVVAFAVTMLWLQPSRDWFAGRTRAVPERRPEPPAPRREQSSDGGPDARPATGPDAVRPDMPRPWGQASTPEGGSAARPYQGFGSAPGSSATDTLARPTTGTPGEGYGYGVPHERGRRPGAVLLACLSTWILSAIVGALMIGGVYEILTNPDPLLDQVRGQQPQAFEQTGLTEQTLVVTTVVLCSLLALWALSAAVLASFAFRGANGARMALLVSASVVAVLGVLGGLLAPVLLPVALGAGITVFGLLRPEVRAWYAARPRR